MSETRLYAVQDGGDVMLYETFSNANGGAMAVWRTLAEKYLGGVSMLSLLMTEMRPVFDLAKKGRLAPWEVVVLLTTYDRVVIPIEHVASVASAFEKFAEEHGPAHEERGFAFSIPAQATALKKIAEGAEEAGWRGVCWNQMSVGDSLWEGVVDEGGDGRRPYNIDRDSRGHWFWPENEQDRKDAEAVRE